ncbi:MAG TPA: type II toxin-antitoxin system RelE/ParE family toxin [Gammaproteobacteria bacterium]|nr:type II toxin-antitoxin system RelE/ParE family toxin [Gammaproteobacteria bacterium]
MRVWMTPAYVRWIDSLADASARARIQLRVDRLVHGHPGTHRRLDEGVSELKIDVGPGYRVYYTMRSGELVILLAGGDKSTQRRDIRRAVELARSL